MAQWQYPKADRGLPNRNDDGKATCPLVNARVAGLFRASMIGLSVLCVWAACDNQERHASDEGATIMFICLPTLLICGGLLWSALRNIPRISVQILTLMAFTLAMTRVELWIRSGSIGRWEDALIVSHSMLVALAAANWLCVWSWRTFSAPEKECSS